MKYKFLLVNKTAYDDYRPNGWLGRLKMFVGDERAVQVGSYTESKDCLKVESVPCFTADTECFCNICHFARPSISLLIPK